MNCGPTSRKRWVLSHEAPAEHSCAPLVAVGRSAARPRARAAIAEPEQEVLVSVVSLWEARIKQSIGKLELPETFRADIEQGFRELQMKPLLHGRGSDRSA